MDAIEMLKKEHAGATEAMEAIVKSPAAKMKALFDALSKDLEIHDHIEETIFYPAIAANPKAAAFPALDKAAHREVEEALAKLKTLPVESKDWIPAFKAMQSKLLKHISDEETKFFVAIRGVLTATELGTLGEKMASGKKTLAKA